jgi:putative transposase
MSTPSHLSRQAQTRLLGADLILRGFDNDEIVDVLQVSHSTVYLWRKKLEDNNNAISSHIRKKGAGRRSRLTTQQKSTLVDDIKKGAVAAGYPNERWTSRRVADYIRRTFQVELKPRAVRYLLRKLGLSPQMPKVKAHKHSEVAVKHWLDRHWKRIKKKQKTQRHPCFH